MKELQISISKLEEEKGIKLPISPGRYKLGEVLEIIMMMKKKQ